MPAFVCVEGERAGPGAVGILAPPGRRTLVIVRPRALEWDLLPVNPFEEGTGARLWEVGRDQAAALSRQLFAALEDWATGGAGRIEPVASSDGQGYEIRASLGKLVLLVCQRNPGQPYRPMFFATVAEAVEAGERLEKFLRPGADANQEIYFNTRQFAR